MRPLCHINLAPTYRGGERQMELLARELAKRGWRQRLVVRRGHGMVDSCADIPDLEVREVAGNLAAAGLAIRGSAIAHAHEARAVHGCLLGNLLFGVPFVITRRVVNPQRKSLIRTLAYDRAAGFATVSRAAARVIRTRHPNLEAVVIPDAHADFVADEKAVQRIRSARENKTLIGHIGALDHSQKGQSTIIDAAKIAAEKYPDWQFLLCGDGKDEARFREEIGDLKNIELVGWVENVGDYMAAFDVFVYPSLHEALGSTLLDAMHLGLPIVATNVGGIPDFVEDGVNGRLIKPEAPDQLLAGIEELLGDESELNALRARNVATAARYDASHMADAYETLYREIVA
jgi:glycosyltransferase involved in cell wall biosynthesis